jgi:hypothetical protein
VRGARRVLEHRRLAPPEPQRAVRPAHRLPAATGCRQRGGQRIGGPHAGGARPPCARQPHGAPGIAVLGLEEREVHVRVDPRGAQQSLLRAHQGERPPSLHDAAGRELGLAERDDVLGQREPRDDSLESLDGRAEVPVRGVDAREAGLRGQVGGEHGERLAVGAARGADAAAAQLEVPEQRGDVGDVLRGARPGGDGEAHRLGRAGQVAVQLADVRGACVGAERRLHVEHVLQGRGCRVVAPELDVRVDEDRVGLRAVRGGAARGLAVAQRGAEVVPREGERAARRVRRSVGGREPAGTGQEAVRLAVPRWVARLPGALQVRAGERSGGGRVAGRLAR